MSPLLVVFALENTRVHIHTTNGGNVFSYIETPIDQHLCVFTTLSILDIYPDNCHIRFRRSLDNSWFGSK